MQMPSINKQRNKSIAELRSFIPTRSCHWRTRSDLPRQFSRAAPERSPSQGRGRVSHHPSGRFAVAFGQWIFRAEGDVDVRTQHLRNVRARDVHPLGEHTLVKAQLLHLLQHLPKKHRSDSIYRRHPSQESMSDKCYLKPQTSNLLKDTLSPRRVCSRICDNFRFGLFRPHFRCVL